MNGTVSQYTPVSNSLLERKLCSLKLKRPMTDKINNQLYLLFKRLWRKRKSLHVPTSTPQRNLSKVNVALANGWAAVVVHPNTLLNN